MPGIGDGVIRRASARIHMYNPSREKITLIPDLLGLHPLNRDGIACNGDRCDTLLGSIVHDGCDPDEADRDNFAVRTSGSQWA